MASGNTFLKVLTGDPRTEEAAGESVTSTVGVNDFCVGKRVDGVDLDVFDVVANHDGRALRTVGEDNGTGAGWVSLRLGGKRLRDRGQVFVWEAGGGRPRLGFSFVADNDIAVGDNLLQLDAEELGDEGCREVKDENLS